MFTSCYMPEGSDYCTEREVTAAWSLVCVITEYKLFQHSNVKMNKFSHPYFKHIYSTIPYLTKSQVDN